MQGFILYLNSFKTYSYPAQSLRALGLILADSAPILWGPQWGGGGLFDASTGFFFTKTAIPREQKVKKSLPTWEMNGLSESYKRAVDQNWGQNGKNQIFWPITEILGPKKRLHFLEETMFWP